MQSGYFVELNLKLKSIIICSVCSFFTISYIGVFHRLIRNIFMRNSICIRVSFKIFNFNSSFAPLVSATVKTAREKQLFYPLAPMALDKLKGAKLELSSLFSVKVSTCFTVRVCAPKSFSTFPLSIKGRSFPSMAQKRR